MTSAGIECFLAICRFKTISRAAEALFITQSSLSIRLKTLEEELGGTLFFRKKGSREMSLTAAGKEFYELALQYEALQQKMLSVCQKQPKNFRVSSFNSLGTYFLPEVCERFLQTYPQIHLQLQDMEVDAAINSLQSGDTELAFTAGKIQSENLIQIPAFREDMILVCGKDLKVSSPIQPDEIPMHQEIFIKWSSRFTQWHEATFPQADPQITVSIMTHLKRFLSQGNAWTIAPLSVVEGLEADLGREIRRIPTSFSIPKREISLLFRAGIDKTVISSFCQSLKDTLLDHPDFECLL